jgi:hypothetical protein
MGEKVTGVGSPGEYHEIPPPKQKMPFDIKGFFSKIKQIFSGKFSGKVSKDYSATAPTVGKIKRLALLFSQEKIKYDNAEEIKKFLKDNGITFTTEEKIATHLLWKKEPAVVVEEKKVRVYFLDNGKCYVRKVKDLSKLGVMMSYPERYGKQKKWKDFDEQVKEIIKSGDFDFEAHKDIAERLIKDRFAHEKDYSVRMSTSDPKKIVFIMKEDGRQIRLPAREVLERTNEDINKILNFDEDVVLEYTNFANKLLPLLHESACALFLKQDLKYPTELARFLTELFNEKFKDRMDKKPFHGDKLVLEENDYVVNKARDGTFRFTGNVNGKAEAISYSWEDITKELLYLSHEEIFKKLFLTK